MKNYLRGSAKDRLARLSTKHQDSDCIIFTGGLTRDGYGRMFYEGRRALSHRVAYEVYCEEIPEGLQVLHKCDNPPCVNPDHLFLGTQMDNIRDMVSKGRASSARGVKHHRAKLNPELAFEIRWYAAMGLKHKDIARKYGVTRPLISVIARNEIWRQECHD